MKKVYLPLIAFALLVIGCQKNESIKPIPNDTPVAAVFSVSDSLQVRFSQGNLQYINGTWRFAEHQTDCLPTFNENSCDLFGWSTDISNWGINASAIYEDYEGGFIDWGMNPDLIAALPKMNGITCSMNVNSMAILAKAIPIKVPASMASMES